MDFFGVGPLEFLVILVVALLVLGPRQLPELAFRLGSLLNQARSSIAQARESVSLEVRDRATASRLNVGGDSGDTADDDLQPRL